MGMPFKFKEASEPTDIIWENRHFFDTKAGDLCGCCKKSSDDDDEEENHGISNACESRTFRELLGYSFVILTLAGSFLFILYLASLEIKFSLVFPAVNCDTIDDTYGTSLEEYAYYD